MIVTATTTKEVSKQSHWCVYIYIYSYIYMHVYTCTRAHISTHVSYACIHMHARAHTSTHVSQSPPGHCVFVYMCLSACLFICCLYMSVCLPLCLFVYLSVYLLVSRVCTSRAHRLTVLILIIFWSVDLSCYWPYWHDDYSPIDAFSECNLC